MPQAHSLELAAGPHACLAVRGTWARVALVSQRPRGRGLAFRRSGPELLQRLTALEP